MPAEIAHYELLAEEHICESLLFPHTLLFRKLEQKHLITSSLPNAKTLFLFRRLALYATYWKIKKSKFYTKLVKLEHVHGVVKFCRTAEVSKICFIHKFTPSSTEKRKRKLRKRQIFAAFSEVSEDEAKN